MFEGIRRNIAKARASLKRLDIGHTTRRLREAREAANRKKRARREFLNVRDEAAREYERLIEVGRDPHDDHVRNVYVRMVKADNHADAFGEMRADLARLARSLKQVLRRKNRTRKKLTADLKKARANLRQHRRDYKPPAPTSGVGIYDGKPIAAWMIPVMNQARANGWAGTLTSGYRSPEYSEQLCYSICGAPVCPGRCAGKTSNHTKNVRPDGAVDVSDPAGFARAQNVLHNALGAADPWHMSVSGG